VNFSFDFNLKKFSKDKRKWKCLVGGLEVAASVGMKGSSMDYLKMTFKVNEAEPRTSTLKMWH